MKIVEEYEDCFAKISVNNQLFWYLFRIQLNKSPLFEWIDMVFYVYYITPSKLNYVVPTYWIFEVF